MGTKQFDNYADLITFTRASGATYLDSDGVLKTASTNIPRIEYDADGNRLGLLVEEQRTNLLTYSENFATGGWTKVRATVTDNTIVAPDGTLTGDKLIPTTDNSNHYVYKTYTAGTHTWTVYAKAGEYGRINLWEGGVTAKYTSFDLNNGTKLQGSADSDSIIPVGNGWYRLSMTVTVSSGTPFFIITALSNDALNHTVSYAGDGTSGIYVWGAQLETGSFSTSYIPTSGSTATRAADVATIPTSAFGYNQTAGTVVVEAQTKDIASNGRLYSIDDGTDTINNAIYSIAGTASHFVVRVNSVTEATFDFGTYVNGVFGKIAGAYKINDVAASLDASTVQTDTSALLPTVTRMRIGNGFATNYLNGHIKSIKYYPRRLTNAQLQELTQ